MSADGSHFTPRPTVYKGITMRSRLEARFAEHCDKVGLEWEYEPICFADEQGQYLPDFLVDDGEQHAYVEVKPNREAAISALRDQMPRIWSSEADVTLIAISETHEGNGYERQPSWEYRVASPCMAIVDVLAQNYIDVLRDGDRLYLPLDGHPVTIDLIDTDEFDAAYHRTKGCNGTAPDSIWTGPELRPCDTWRLVMGTHTNDPWWPTSIEVTDGLVTDTYVGQFFFMNKIWGHLEQICRIPHPYPNTPVARW